MTRGFRSSKRNCSSCSTALPRADAEVHEAYRMVQGCQRLLGQMRQAIQDENAAALKREEARYKQTTDGEWLETRETIIRP